MYPAEYDDRGRSDDASFYGRFDAAPPRSSQPEEWGVQEAAGYPPGYEDAGARRSEPRTSRSGVGQWGRGWSSRIDVEASDDWD